MPVIELGRLRDFLDAFLLADGGHGEVIDGPGIGLHQMFQT